MKAQLEQTGMYTVDTSSTPPRWIQKFTEGKTGSRAKGGAGIKRQTMGRLASRLC